GASSVRRRLQTIGGGGLVVERGGLDRLEVRHLVQVADDGHVHEQVRRLGELAGRLRGQRLRDAARRAQRLRRVPGIDLGRRADRGRARDFARAPRDADREYEDRGGGEGERRQ